MKTARELFACHGTDNFPFPSRIYIQFKEDNLLPCPAAEFSANNRYSQGRADKCCLNM